MSALFALRPWLKPYEVAVFLSETTGTKVRVWDIYRAALDGVLELSVLLPTPVSATAIKDGERTKRRESITGTCELLLEAAGKLEIENVYAEITHGRVVPVRGKQGALVRHGQQIYELPPDAGSRGGMSPRRPSAIPQDSQIVVAMTAVRRFQQRLSQKPSTSNEKESGKPLSSRERNNLYKIILGLTAGTGIDLEKPFKVAQAIETDVRQLGLEISHQTISLHLQRALELLSDRSKVRKKSN